MITKALNEEFLWKGKLQQNKHTTLQYNRPPMILPKINSLTGKPYPTKDTIHDEICMGSYEISCKYWEGLKHRMDAYRKKNTVYIE